MRRGAWVRTGALVVAATLALAGCSSKGGGTAASNDPATHQASVTLTDAGCEPTTLTMPAGPTTFHVSNADANGVTELEVKDGDHVLGEVENIAPGLSGSFSLTLQPGTYTLSCSGLDGALTVQGGTQVSGAAAAAAVATYRTYVEERAATLVTRTRAFTNAVVRGNIPAAKSLFAPAREPYEAIEPIAESFGNLDPEIDARANDVPAGHWTGFHRIEKALWVDDSLAGMTPLAHKLMADVTRLNTLVKTVKLEPAQIANGASELLNEVSTSKITGEEDRYSHTDLWDFQANVDGADAAFTALEPLLKTNDPDLATQIRSGFGAVDHALTPYRRGTGFVLYTDLNQKDTRALSQVIDALAEPLSNVAAIVVVA